MCQAVLELLMLYTEDTYICFYMVHYVQLRCIIGADSVYLIFFNCLFKNGGPGESRTPVQNIIHFKSLTCLDYLLSQIIKGN